MLGAIVGDVLGSALEFEERKYENIDDINLYDEENHFTDDTVLTLAVADWLLHDIDNYYYDDEKLKEALGKRFVKWTQQYRLKEIAYGNSYIQWFFRAELIGEYNPYQSFGNGSAMRVSPVGWYFDTLEETLRFAKISADVTLLLRQTRQALKSLSGFMRLKRDKSEQYTNKPSSNIPSALERDSRRRFTKTRNKSKACNREAVTGFLL